MQNCNCKVSSNPLGSSRLLRIFGFLAFAALIAIGSGTVSARASDSPIIAKCKVDLAARLKLQVPDITEIEARPTVWPDAALGLPEIGKVYAQVQTPGLRVILEARSSRYLYTTSTKAFRYGGPISVWSYSMLYTEPVQDEPNLNRDLYQCSLLGTNSVRVFSGVTDYYPQDKGFVIVKRRTSRSGHELLLVKVGEAAKAKTLHGAFDFGDAALNGAQDEWAGFVRSSLGFVWEIVVARTADASGVVKTISLPEGVGPGRIAWSGDMLYILVKKGDNLVCYETSPKVATPEWRITAGPHVFPGLKSFMLNKSESLEISPITQNGKPGVEVASVWFTGTRKAIATISDFTLRDSELIGGYAFIRGEKGSETRVYTVDISTGEVILSFHGSAENIKPFIYPPHSGPMKK